MLLEYFLYSFDANPELAHKDQRFLLIQVRFQEPQYDLRGSFVVNEFSCNIGLFNSFISKLRENSVLNQIVTSTRYVILPVLLNQRNTFVFFRKSLLFPLLIVSVFVELFEHIYKRSQSNPSLNKSTSFINLVSLLLNIISGLTVVIPLFHLLTIIVSIILFNLFCSTQSVAN